MQTSQTDMLNARAYINQVTDAFKSVQTLQPKLLQALTRMELLEENHSKFMAII
jgi:hypothetical protein